jgi:hypothetical protein
VLVTDVFTRAARRIWRAASPRRRRIAAGLSGALTHRILVGTHHKTGTVWLSAIFARICRDYRLSFFAGNQNDLPAGCRVFVQDHSKFDFDALSGPHRGLHLIRDPRDVIVSGCFYHQHSGEDWLHVRQAELGGASYAEKINSYRSLEDQILFEMEHIGAQSIREMLDWNYARPNFIEIKYEDLIEDHDLALFRRIFSFLGFPDPSIPELLEIARDGSLFSGNVGPSTHVRSGRSRQWPEHFTPRHRSRFIELFGDALVRLGYEPDDHWAH